MAVSIGWKSFVIGIMANSIKALLHRCTIRVSTKNKHSYKKRNARNIDASKSLHFRSGLRIFFNYYSRINWIFFSSFTRKTFFISSIMTLSAIASSPINFKIESNIFFFFHIIDESQFDRSTPSSFSSGVHLFFRIFTAEREGVFSQAKKFD